MSKHNKLTIEELDEFTPNNCILEVLNNYISENNINKDNFKILDWGCGRGKEVYWLRLKGFNVVGVDIDQEPISNELEEPIQKDMNENVDDWKGQQYENW